MSDPDPWKKIAQSRGRGKSEKKETEHRPVKCSMCGHLYDRAKHDCCPNCGANPK